jgi:effector-binding domain-containing protein
MMKKSINKSISNIKEEVEKRKKGIYNGYQVKEKSQNQKHYVTSRSNVKIPEIGQYYQQNIAAVFKKLIDNGIATIGAPALLFYTYDEIKQESDLAIGVPVLNPVNIKDLSSQSLPAQNTIYVDHYGDMALTGEGHQAIDAYMKDRKIPQKYPVLEEYITDPLKEKDMKKWLTKITYYVGETK